MRLAGEIAVEVKDDGGLLIQHGPPLGREVRRIARHGMTGTDGAAHLAEYLASEGGRGTNGVDDSGRKTLEYGPESPRRGGRADDGTGLENRRALAGTGGSNPSLSAMAFSIQDSRFRTCDDGLRDCRRQVVDGPAVGEPLVPSAAPAPPDRRLVPGTPGNRRKGGEKMVLCPQITLRVNVPP